MPKDPWHPQCDDGYKSNLEFDQTPQEVHLKGQNEGHIMKHAQIHFDKGYQLLGKSPTNV